MSTEPSALDARQMAGFKDFYQYVDHTRVIAGRSLIESIGFEFMKEGANRVFVVTDQVIRGTGLIDKVEAGVTDGGLEVAGIFDHVRGRVLRHLVEHPGDLEPAVRDPGLGPLDQAGRADHLVGDHEDAVSALLLELEAGRPDQVAAGDHTGRLRVLVEVLEGRQAASSRS